MPAAVWWGVKFTPGGHATFFGIVNTFIHVIMYTYYLLAAMGPKYQKYLWWKKHLTTMQMVQFITVFFHTAQLFFIDCNFPKILAYVMCFHSIMFLGLFSNFYIQAYIKRRRLPIFKMVQEDNKEAKEKSTKKNDGKANTQSSKAVGKVIANIMTNASAACYIGQNGLYQNKSQEKSKEKSLNGHFNGFKLTNGHSKDDNLDKKQL